MPKTPRAQMTDQERIAELEQRVEELEEEAVYFRAEMGTVLRLKLDYLLRHLGADPKEIELGMDLGNTLSLDSALGQKIEAKKMDPVSILGDLGLPPLEKRAGRGRKG